MRRIVSLASLALIALAQTAAGQEVPADPAPASGRGGIEEITITAEKRETNVQDTPIAVTAITADALAEQGLEDFNDVQFMAPAVVNGEIADMEQITIRGIGVDISTIDAEPGVALHQDGVDDPLTSVVLGVGKILDELDLLRKVSVMSQANNLR